MSALGNSLAALFAAPIPAASSGVVVGALMLFVTYRGSRTMTPEFPELGVARALAMSGIGLVAAFAGLSLYFFFARDGLVCFGLGLVAGFMVPALVALFAMSGIAKPVSKGGR